MHSSCGAFGINKPCMNQNGVCTKGFPQEFSDETALPSEKYPVYRRRDDGRCIEKRGAVLDNRWVVTYNPFPAKKFKAHINVQVCTSIKSVKYLYKYTH